MNKIHAFIDSYEIITILVDKTIKNPQKKFYLSQEDILNNSMYINILKNQQNIYLKKLIAKLYILLYTQIYYYLLYNLVYDKPFYHILRMVYSYYNFYF